MVHGSHSSDAERSTQRWADGVDVLDVGSIFVVDEDDEAEDVGGEAGDVEGTVHAEAGDDASDGSGDEVEAYEDVVADGDTGAAGTADAERDLEEVEEAADTAFAEA